MIDTEQNYSSLVWSLMPHCGGPQPVTTTCIFTDGYAGFMIGWWSRDLQRLYIPNANGTNGVVDHQNLRWWAPLGNLQGFRTADATPGVEGQEPKQ